jgi:predicted  nucleic acid-binding Zn-ribbon protein
LLFVDVRAEPRQNEQMGTVEDIRQVFQDFLAPELRAITARLDSIEERFEARFDGTDQRFEALRTEFNLRLEAVAAKQDTKFAILDGKIQHIIDMMDLERRVKKLESQQAEQPAA